MVTRGRVCVAGKVMDASCKRYGDYQSMLSRDLRECSSTYIAAKDGTIHLLLMLFSERREN